MTTFTVVSSGLATVQDLGRRGQAHLGISPNGAADAWSARVANILAGNRDDAPLVEATASTLTVRTDRAALIAVTGAADRLFVDGVPIAVSEPVLVHAGATITVPTPPIGRRTYLAVNGGFAAAAVLGSVAPDHLLGSGTRLHAGDRIGARTGAAPAEARVDVPLFRLDAPRRRLTRELTVDLTPGPDADEFDAAIWDEPIRAFEVTEHSDHVGLRLAGPALKRLHSKEILSRPVPTGTVEAPPGGGLIVLLRGRFLTAGYPALGVATSVAVDELGQAAPGDTLRFRLVTIAEARAALVSREQALDALARRVATALTASGFVVDVRHRGNAIAPPSG